ncbi:MAG: hypothetical protein M1826_005048 [Phylliscum demangeonii]|nr:MAG: hypothetical protein M1826_005048 [Phylliscum demangeonii]
MAWRSSGTSNAALIANLASNGLIKSERVRRAMLGVDRAHYAPAAAYEDSPQSIGMGATISAPHMHASACESLLAMLHDGSRVLDIGAGSGYLTHVLANLVAPHGTVVAVEHIQGLVDVATQNMGKSAEGRALLRSGRVRFVRADGRAGFPQQAPYDAIHVGAAAVTLHQPLLDQLKTPGRMFIPVEDDDSSFANGSFPLVASTPAQHIWVVDKMADGTVEKKKLFGVAYVPLTDAPTS